MEKPIIDIGNIIRNLARRIHHVERGTPVPEYRIIHTPDRPRCPIEPSNIPSDEECAVLLLDMQRREEQRRAREGRTQDPEEGVPALGESSWRMRPWSSLLKSSRTESLRRPPGRDTPDYRYPAPRNKGPEKHFDDMLLSDKWENPRAAPRPHQQNYRRTGSLPGIQRYPTPDQPTGDRCSTPLDERADSASFSIAPSRSSSRFGSLPFSRRRPPGFSQNEVTYEEAVNPFKTARRSRAASLKARDGCHLAEADDEEEEEEEEEEGEEEALSPTTKPRPSNFSPDPKPRSCQLPWCDKLAVRSTQGPCEVCEGDYKPRTSVFVKEATKETLKALACPPPLPDGGRAAGCGLAPAPQAQEAWPSHTKEHIAQQMRIITPPTSPRKISVSSSSGSPTKSPVAGSPLRVRQNAVRLLEMPVDRSVSVSAERNFSHPALAYVKQIVTYQEQARDPHKQNSLIMGFGSRTETTARVINEDGEHVAAVGKVNHRPYSGWEGSDYYFDDANFKDRVDEWVSTHEQRRNQVPHSLEFRVPRQTLLKSKGKGEEDSDEDTPTSLIFSVMPSTRKMYANYPNILREYSSSPSTPNIGKHSRA